MSSKQKKIFLFSTVIILILGVFMILYPIISSHYAETVRSEIKTEYHENLNQADTSEIDAIRNDAMEYNRRLFSGLIDLLDLEGAGYYDQLNVTNNGIMGYIVIPKIDVNLPIYHGTDQEYLAYAAGHMAQTSLPVGGKNTHSVISAHSASASSTLFSDLPLLEERDYFFIEILGQTLTYQVLETSAVPNPIQTVLPEAVDSVQIIRDQDLVTLITCTPYGVNSHRLLVTGTRVENPGEGIRPDMTVDTENSKKDQSIWTQEYMRGIYNSILLTLIALLALIDLILYITLLKKRKSKQQATAERPGERK